MFDRARTKPALARTRGRKTAERPININSNIGVGEALLIERGDRLTLQGVQERECQGLQPASFAETCRMQVETDARTVAQQSSRDALDTMQNLRQLFIGLGRIDAPKTMILISEGFVLTDEPTLIELGGLAAEARTSVYALKLDGPIFDLSDSRSPSRSPATPFSDRQARSEGLETLAGAARGALFTVTGTGQAIFDRIESEISGYYLVGVDSDPRDRDGKTHSIRVDVTRKGALVRARRQILSTSAERRAGAARTPRQLMALALGSPLLASALPLRVASFALQGPETGQVQILIHADIGSDYTASKVASIGYVITDATGRTVENRGADMRLQPVMSGVPSALQYTTGASLPPGDYTLKLAAAEADRVGTVEHIIHATLPRAGTTTTSELMVGGPVEVGELLTPTIGYQVTFGTVHAYVEAYGSTSGSLTAEYEIATANDAPALLNIDVAPHVVSDTRTIFSKVIPIHQLPPARYIMRAILSSDGRAVATLSRAFEVATAKVLMTAADGLGDHSLDGELYLPVDEATMSPTFVRDEALGPETLDAFRERLAPSVKTEFDQGTAFLAAGDYPKAEASFKRGIDPEVDSTSSMTYLAASFAAGGHDREGGERVADGAGGRH